MRTHPDFPILEGDYTFKWPHLRPCFDFQATKIIPGMVLARNFPTNRNNSVFSFNPEEAVALINRLKGGDHSPNPVSTSLDIVWHLKIEIECLLLYKKALSSSLSGNAAHISLLDEAVLQSVELLEKTLIHEMLEITERSLTTKDETTQVRDTKHLRLLRDVVEFVKKSSEMSWQFSSKPVFNPVQLAEIYKLDPAFELL